MSDPDSVAKWLQIRDNSLSLHRLGENPGQILRWSRDKTVQDVSNRSSIMKLPVVIFILEEKY